MFIKKYKKYLINLGTFERKYSISLIEFSDLKVI